MQAESALPEALNEFYHLVRLSLVANQRSFSATALSACCATVMSLPFPAPVSEDPVITNSMSTGIPLTLTEKYKWVPPVAAPREATKNTLLLPRVDLMAP
mmetsp:Transcript_21441/g.41627  ORF Transcript_21441/g.41627 Transcript_21441/m.41627 type:complete len:100 (-) Transcript_21441:2632-2931(-)